MPGTREFHPAGDSPRREAVVLTVDEYEAIRLIDRQGFSQEECSAYMQVARTTVQMIYNSARKKLAAALVGQLHPAAVVCVDSLCSAEGQRLGRTVQFSDSGLYPAQADHTRHLTRDTVGVPVVAAGIPTLMQAQEGADLVVTPRALDSVIAHGAALLAGSVNRALQPRLTVQQLCWLTG